MKLPYSWLQELIPQLPPLSALEPTFAQIGLPLEGIESAPAPAQGVLLAAVTEAAAMPGTQLTKLTLNMGEHGPRTIASGAPNAVNLSAGTMVALVIPGTTARRHRIRRSHAARRGIVGHGRQRQGTRHRREQRRTAAVSSEYG